MPRRIGQLRNCVKLLKQVNQPIDNDGGEDEEFYNTIDERFADVVPISAGSRNFTTRNVSDTSTHQVWIRHDEAIENRGIIDHLVFKDRMFEIQNIVTDNEDIRFLVLECRDLGLVVDPDSDNDYDIRP